MTIRLASALAFGIAAFAPPLAAVNLSNNGTGQVLIFPYYTVYANQQTLVSVINTSTSVGKVVKVRFREAYNGRAVMDFNLYLSPADVWTANVFALTDAGIAGDGAALFSTDNSCTDPALNTSGKLSNGAGYLSFSSAVYTGANADTGPVEDARMREGHIEMILMSDIVPKSNLEHAIRHVNSVPLDCHSTTLQAATGYAAPTEDPDTGAPGSQADGGLYGSASIVNVADGVFYAYNADALDGFSYVSLYTHPGDTQPTLASVNDRDNPNAATARMFVNGEQISATFPGATSGSRAVDAVSAVFAANQIDNEYVYSYNGAIGTDWVLTFPTKDLYVDAQPGGAIAGASSVFAPFEQLFGAKYSCVPMARGYGITIFDREEDATTPDACDIGGHCPPNVNVCLETNVFGISLLNQRNLSVLGSPLVSAILPIASTGWLRWDISQPGHQLQPASNGNIFLGLPITGFAATKFVNSIVPTSGGPVLANYTATYHHRSRTTCKNGNGACT